MMRRALLAIVMLALPFPLAARAEEGTLACSCRACDPDVCCKAPSGFAALDEKCAPKCTTKRWTVKEHQNCAPQSGCCPLEKRTQ
jgi:hypothetical protein